MGLWLPLFPNREKKGIPFSVYNVVPIRCRQIGKSLANGDLRVKLETRERVQNAIEELNYYPNAIARALIRQRAMTIGLIFAKMDYVLSEPYISQLIYHIEKALIPHDYDMLIVSGEQRNGRDLTLLFKQKKVDGAIILGSPIGDPRVSALSENRSPTVVLHAHSELPAATCRCWTRINAWKPIKRA